MIHISTFVILSFSTCLLFILKLENIDRTMNEQLRLHQCASYQLKNFNQTKNRLHKLDRVIQASHLGVLLPGAGQITSKQVRKLAKASQELVWLNHLKNVVSGKYCRHIIYQSFLLPAPFKRGGILFKRNKDQTIKKTKKGYQKITINTQVKSAIRHVWKKDKMKSSFIDLGDISQLNYLSPSSLFSRPFFHLSR